MNAYGKSRAPVESGVGLAARLNRIATLPAPRAGLRRERADEVRSTTTNGVEKNGAVYNGMKFICVKAYVWKKSVTVDQ